MTERQLSKIFKRTWKKKMALACRTWGKIQGT